MTLLGLCQREGHRYPEGESMSDDKITQPARSRIDAEFLERRTEMFSKLDLKGYWRIGTGDPKMVPKRKPKKS
jgi:hypothetical protein